ncbi:MAG TPA: hypothetical protein VMS93_06825 [Candidatus Saccharimonadales bacterium]|nr:hypothetical protein [Candidatus Saccharimonadales bacterium]
MISAFRNRGAGRAPALLAALLALGAAGAARAQGTWTVFVNTHESHGVALDGDGVWSAGFGGATRFARDGQSAPQVLTRSPSRLTSSLLTAVHATPDGRMWFGTSGAGVQRWDRTRDTWAVLDSTSGLPSGYVTRLRDDGVNLWVGTQLGYAVINGDQVIQSCAAVEDSCLPNLFVRDILCAGTQVQGVGPYFFATEGGVTAFDGTHWVQLAQGLPDSADVTCLARVDTALYCGSGTVVYRYGPAGWVPAATSPDAVTCMATSAGRLIVGRPGGVSVLAGGALVTLGSGLSSVVDVAASGDTVWAATPSGLYMNASGAGGWADLFAAANLDQPPFNDIDLMALQPTGTPRLWLTRLHSATVMAYDRSRASGHRWLTLGPADGLEPVEVHSLCADRDGFVWAGHCCSPDATRLGADVVDARGSVPFVKSHFLRPPHNPLAIVEDPVGRKWFGTGDDGDSLYVFCPADLHAGTTHGDSVAAWNGFTPTSLGAGTLPAVRIKAIAFHGQDRWFGAYESGLAHWRPASAVADPCLTAPSPQDLWVQYQGTYSTDNPHYIPGQKVRALLAVGDSVWVGTTEGLGVIQASADVTLRSFGIEDGVPATGVTSLAQGPDGSLWLATASGLGVYRDGGFTFYTTDNSPLPTNAVDALVVEGTSVPYNLWIGTALGVVQLEVGAGVTPPAPSATLRLYPHPFRPGVHSKLALEGSFVSAGVVRISDARGQTVREFRDVAPNQGFWDGRDAEGRYVGTGMYRVVVEADGVIHRLSLVVVR